MAKAKKRKDGKDELKQMIEKMRKNHFNDSGFKADFKSGAFKKGVPGFRRPQNKG